MPRTAVAKSLNARCLEFGLQAARLFMELRPKGRTPNVQRFVDVRTGRNKIGTWLLVLAGAALLYSGAAAADPHERMMRATFKIKGKKKSSTDEEAGAAFVVAWPAPSSTSASTRLALITAAHFFEKIEGEKIDLVGRRLRDDGTYEKELYPIPIRNGDTALWIRHPDPEVDAALIELDWPEGCDVVPVGLEQFATTESIESGAYRPGREVFAPGYPFAIESSAAGFPVLRKGLIASYPPPRGEERTFLVDAAIFAGFSGSPVYALDDEATADPIILGAIVRQHELTSDFQGPFETRKVHYMLDLAVVVKAAILREWLRSIRGRAPATICAGQAFSRTTIAPPGVRRPASGERGTQTRRNRREAVGVSANAVQAR